MPLGFNKSLCWLLLHLAVHFSQWWHYYDSDTQISFNFPPGKPGCSGVLLKDTSSGQMFANTNVESLSWHWSQHRHCSPNEWQQCFFVLFCFFSVTINAHERPKPKCIYHSQKLLTFPVISQKPRAPNVSENPLNCLQRRSLGTPIILWCVLLILINNWTKSDNVKSSGWDISSEAAMAFKAKKMFVHL